MVAILSEIAPRCERICAQLLRAIFGCSSVSRARATPAPGPPRRPRTRPMEGVALARCADYPRRASGRKTPLALRQIFLAADDPNRCFYPHFYRRAFRYIAPLSICLLRCLPPKVRSPAIDEARVPFLRIPHRVPLRSIAISTSKIARVLLPRSA